MGFDRILLLVFIGIITYMKICSDLVGISAMLALAGIREAVDMMGSGGFFSRTIYHESEFGRSPKVPRE